MKNSKRILGALLAGCIAAALAVPALAADENGNTGGATPAGNGTEVWAGVAVDEPDARIKVTVPTLFAFVVNGTVDAQKGTDAITVDNDALLLPNVKVTNADATDPANQTYTLETVGDPAELRFENFSTWLTDANDPTSRVGMELKVTGSIKNEGTETSRGGWTTVGAAPNTTTQDVKKYQVGVGINTDLNGVTWFTELPDGTFGLTEAQALTLAAPQLGATLDNLDPTTQLAIDGEKSPVTFNVRVGGTRGDYKTVENSAKVGTITWMVQSQDITATNP